MKTTKMLSMNDKMLKVILLVAIFATQVPLVHVSAQDAVASETKPVFMYESSGVPMEIGDSVWIHKDSLRYLTGERMSTWVYDVPHTIRQLGTKTKPTGVLLRGIYSWIAQGSLIPANAKKVQAIEAEKQAIIDAENARIAAEEAAKRAEAEAIARAEAAKQAELEAAQYAEYLEEQDSIARADSIAKLPKPYQVDRFTVGLRGGFASSLAKSLDKTPLGFDVLLDLQYAHYWAKDADKPLFGILTGLSVGYMQDTYKLQAYNDNFTLNSEGPIAYSVTASDIKAVNHQVQVEVPLMFSMILPCGVFVNAGPKVILPVYTTYNQTFANPEIIATLQDVGVTIDANNPVMGFVAPEQCSQKGKNGNQMKLTLALGAEIGYEFIFKSGHSLGLGAYVNGGVFNAYKPTTNAVRHMIDVQAPTATKAAEVTVHSLGNSVVDKMGYLDAGLKVSYNFNWIKK